MPDGGASNRIPSWLKAAALALGVFALIAALRTGGYLERLEHGVADFRDTVLQHEVESDIVIVGIDPASIQELGQWPWPRHHHARLIEQLRQANPRQLFLDIDFSSPSVETDDAQLEAALQNWRELNASTPLILPMFVQPATGTDARPALTKPLERFARNVTLGAVNQKPGTDGSIRNSMNAVTVDGTQYPSVVTRVAAIRGAAADKSVLLPIDYSISPSSFGFVSYSDVLRGRVPAEEFAGKTVLVGATALELGDMLAVPVYRSLPGVIVQALAIETARHGNIQQIAPAAYWPLLALWTLACTALFCLLSWRGNLTALFTLLATLAGLAVYAYASHRLALEVLPPALCAGLAFFAVTLRSLDEHIKERQAQRRRLEYQAKHDALTTLPNRVALTEHLERLLPEAVPNESVALLMLDLCRFKEVNDTLGHNIGDSVLQEVARRFREQLKNTPGCTFIARIGGDEFTVVLNKVSHPQDVEVVAQSLQDSLKEPIEAAGIALDVGLSIGIARYPQDAHDEQTLLKRADVAMYLSKRHSLPFEHYDAAQDEHSVRRLTMVTELRNALANRTIQLFYQPQIDLRSGRAIGAEALMRWNHPVLGFVSPAEFIPVAEATDLIRPLTEWALTEALQQIARWQKQGRELRIAVNISARMLQDSRFPARVKALLENSHVSPHLLELEITESAMMLDPARALRTVNELHALGVLISVDDYGTGFSSLSYLRDLPIHAIKLDKSFVLGMKERHDNRVIVESTAEMARALNLQVIAEGAESPWHVRFLVAAGYDYAQGYCYSPALAPDAFIGWLDKFAIASPALTEQIERSVGT